MIHISIFTELMINKTFQYATLGKGAGLDKSGVPERESEWVDSCCANLELWRASLNVWIPFSFSYFVISFINSWCCVISSCYCTWVLLWNNNNFPLSTHLRQVRAPPDLQFSFIKFKLTLIQLLSCLLILRLYNCSNLCLLQSPTWRWGPLQELLVVEIEQRTPQQ